MLAAKTFPDLQESDLLTVCVVVNNYGLADLREAQEQCCATRPCVQPTRVRLLSMSSWELDGLAWRTALILHGQVGSTYNGQA